MIFRQIIHEDLGCASYLVGDAHAGVAAVVDPRLDCDIYLELAAALGVTVTDIFETHNHADHVSGHGRLAAATGATIRVHALVDAQFAHAPFEHGDEWQLGAVHIRALHTPGHRPEHSAFLLSDTSRGADPWALLAGDSLFVGAIARPDLAVDPTEGARGIFHSLHGQVLPLPDHVELWPGHLGGSMCGGPGMDLKISSSIGFERRHNRLLRLQDEAQFTADLLDGLGAQPPNYRQIVEINRGPLIPDSPTPGPVAPDALDGQAALIIDLRGHQSYAAGHIPDSVSIPLGTTGFGTRLAWLADGEQPVVLVGNSEADTRAAATLAAAVGLERNVGYLAGGPDAWDGPLATTEQLAAADAGARLAGDPRIQLLDVRDRADWEASHVPGSVCVPWHELTTLPDGVDPSAPVAVFCASGMRAGIAAGLLERSGATSVIHITDGGVGELLRTASAPAS